MSVKSGGNLRLEEICSAIEKYHPSPDFGLVKAAYEYASAKHADQKRASGEPYMVHLVEVALLVCELKLDVPSVAAALLHDIIEDCTVSHDELADLFTDEIADIVEGVTKLTRIEFSSAEEKQAESFRKMLLAMAKDIRVILVKLCDRLHNMKTLGWLPEEKRQRIARETREIYAPLANRLGIQWLKSELEDLCLMHLRPELYKLISESFDRTGGERDQYIQDTASEIAGRLRENGISASVKGRSKHYYSIWQKMERDNLSFDDVYDLLGFRVIVPSIRATYETLGIIHSIWKPVPKRFKDYIAMPKPNMYQSLHTTVIGPKGHRIEIQVRTPEMDRIAEEGIAAHWRYKEGRGMPAFDLKWVRDLVESQQYLKSPDEFIQSVKSELFPEEVFVFTPKGDLIRLPFGSTPIDFAYAVHTDIGHQTTGARVNGSIVPLETKLQNGDTLEVLTVKGHVPSKDWLRFVQSSKAKQRIRTFLRSEERARSLAVGMELLARDMKKVKLNIKKLEKEGRLLEIAQSLGLKNEADLYAEIGYGKIGPAKVISRLMPEEVEVEGRLEDETSPLRRIIARAALVSREKLGVKVSGFDDIMVRFARCCEPLPGDRIAGFITRGRGVTVHHADCGEVMHSDPLRRVEVSWDTEAHSKRRVRLVVSSQDTVGILSAITKAISEGGANITSAQIKTTSLGKASNAFEIVIEDVRQLNSIIRGVENISGVIKVERSHRSGVDSGRRPRKKVARQD